MITRATITAIMLATTMIACYLCCAVKYILPMWMNFLVPGVIIIFSGWFCKQIRL